MSDKLSDEHKTTLRGFVEAWINEGFTTPPYTDVQYDIFEWLALDPEDPFISYDIRRPASNQERGPS